jgi:tetratricopeptide (TPR) repeat protein
MAPDSAPADDAAIRAMINAFWNEYLDLSLAIAEADQAPAERRARSLETLRQTTSRLLERAERELPAWFPDEDPRRHVTPERRAHCLACFYQLRARVYFRLAQREKCLADYERSIDYNPSSNLHLYENYIEACIELGEPARAAEIANQAPLALWKTEGGSVASRVFGWARAHAEFAARLRPEVNDECRQLVGREPNSSRLP